MLKLPERDDPFVTVAFDPGSYHLGVSVMEDKLDGSKKVVRESYTVHLKDNHPHYSAFAELQGNKQVRLLQMSDAVVDVLRRVKPHAIIVESNYLGRFAAAFAALVECVVVIRSAVFQYDPFLPLWQIDPSTVKINAGMKKVKGTDKNDVKVAMMARDDIEWLVDPDELDEHSIDACAVALYCATNICQGKGKP
jgi:Holliday junction resolvasome RuvABC endonuclease subunit